MAKRKPKVAAKREEPNYPDRSRVSPAKIKSAMPLITRPM